MLCVRSHSTSIPSPCNCPLNNIKHESLLHGAPQGPRQADLHGAPMSEEQQARLLQLYETMAGTQQQATASMSNALRSLPASCYSPQVSCMCSAALG